MYSSEDFERFYIRYKAEAVPAKESIQKFCIRNGVPYNLFQKWYKDTRHRVVPVTVTGCPSEQEIDEPAETNSEVKQTVNQSVRIQIDIRMTNGLHIQQRNLNYSGLIDLIENLEALC